ncbi:MAG: ornithine carbamoyltransferase [Candidatus Diapherotrites archaeon]|nr:ornithine carbamoyltransferase [Candidatus Diapherotrites archaeon]
MNDRLSVSHIVSLYDLSTEDFNKIFKKAAALKKDYESGKKTKILENKTLAMIFEKPSTRTRVSFEAAMTQLGGHAQYIDATTTQSGRGETIADTARVLSKYVDGIMARVNDHSTILDFVINSEVPVINGLSDFNHPVQALSDMFTIWEKKKKFKGLKLAWVGDATNVCHSLMYACGKLDVDMWIAVPNLYRPNKGVIIEADKLSLAATEITTDPKEAASDADVVYTDTWASMGSTLSPAKKKALEPYQVNKELVKHAKKDYLFMHCLPAHRGEEVTTDVIDGPNSIIFDQAENRLHVQKAILSLML